MPTLFAAKITIRRGLKADLPDLSKAELGFTTDTGEVFIGAPDLPSLVNKGRGESNELFPYKNVQLITAENNLSGVQPYTYKSNSTTVAQTGPSPTQPVSRSYQNKFDDHLNLDDFIDNPSDVSPAITRALQQNNTINKTLRISARTYTINTPFQITPNSHIKGEGIDRTILAHTNIDPLGPTYLAETADNNFQTGLQISFNQGGLPENIVIEDMTIVIPRLMDFFRINRGKNIKFKNVKFKGAGATTSTTHVFTFDKLGIVVAMNNFTIEDCVFEDVSNVFNDALLITNVISNVNIRNNRFVNVFKLLSLDNNSSSNYEFSGNFVSRTFSNFITLQRGKTFKSFNNYFEQNQTNIPIFVGQNFINFKSINDDFNTTHSIENNSKTATIILDGEKHMIINDMEKSSTKKYTLLASTNTILPLYFPIDKYDFIRVNYKISANNEIKIGSFDLTLNGNTPILFDTGTSTGSINVDITPEIVNYNSVNNIALRYNNTNASNANIVLSYEAVIL